jgi:hypothetical protein
MFDKPSQMADVSTLPEANSRSSVVILRGSNNALDRSAVSTFHMALAGKAGQHQRARSALPLDPRRASRESAMSGKPSQAANV